MKVRLTAAVLALGALPLDAAISADSNTNVTLDLDRQPLEAALVELSKQGQLQLVIATGSLPARIAEPLHGNMPLGLALDRLLRDTGLTYKLVGDHTIAIVKSAKPGRASDPPTLPGASGVAGSDATNIDDRKVDQGAQGTNEHRGDRSVNHRGIMLRLAAFFGLCVSGAATYPACAADDSSGAQGQLATLELGEVVVTAERRQTDLQRTPSSIVAWDAEALLQRQISDIGELARATPNLSTSSDVEGLRPVFIMRGVGNSSGRETQEAGVALYVDDIYLPRSNGAYLQLVDVDRVEVLRGPQGTLFGRNSSGGAIRYITNKPTHELELRGMAAVGTNNLQDLTLLTNLPFGDKVAGRFQFGSFRQDGYLDLTYNNFRAGSKNDVVSRGVLRLFASDNLTIDAGSSYSTSQRERPTTVVVTNNIADAQARGLSAFLTSHGQSALTVNDPRFVTPVGKYSSTGACFLGTNTLPANGTTIIDSPIDACQLNQKQRTQVSFLDVNWELAGGLAARLLSGLTDGKTFSVADGGGLGVTENIDNSHYGSASQELQLKYNSDRLHWVGGLYYFREHTNRTILARALSTTLVPVSTLGQCCTGSFTWVHTNTASKGAFGQVTMVLLTDLEATLGARYSRDDKEITLSRADRPASPASLTGKAFGNTGNWSHADYRGTLQYQLTPSAMAYATVATGYKAGGFNDSIPVTLTPATLQNGGLYPYNPEKVTNYELGAKTQWFDNRVRLNLSAFRMDYSDMQLSTPIIDTTTTPPTTVVVVQNAARIRLTGVEGELAWLITRGLQVDANFSTLHESIEELANGSGLLIASTCVGGVQSLATCQVQDGTADAPKYQYSGSVLYTVPVRGGALSAGLSYAYTAQKNSLNSAAANFVIPGYGLLNAHLDYAPVGANWSLSLIGTNITNKYYYLTGQNGTGAFGTVTADVGRPAVYSLQLRARL